VDDLVNADAEAEKNKKLLEWELSTLEADDLRSHAWYHGQQVNRAQAERLLRKYVAEQYGSATTTTTNTANTTNKNSKTLNNITATAVKGSSSVRPNVEDTSDSDELEDISSENSDMDFANDDFLDDLEDESGMLSDPSVSTTAAISASLLLQQRRKVEGALSTKIPKRPHRHRRHFYCFLVRDSINVRPPGRYVVSCLRFDKYDEDLEAEDKNETHYDDDEQKRKKCNRRQQKQRQRKQQRYPVLHFVINEVSDSCIT